MAAARSKLVKRQNPQCLAAISHHRSSNTKRRIIHLSDRVLSRAAAPRAFDSSNRAAIAAIDGAARISDRYLPCREFRDRRGTGARAYANRYFIPVRGNQGSWLGYKVIFSREIQRGALRFAESGARFSFLFFFPSVLLSTPEMETDCTYLPRYLPFELGLFFPIVSSVACPVNSPMLREIRESRKPNL